MTRFRVWRISCFTAGASLALLAIWSLLWVVSSYSMAFSACEASFSLFAPNLRCRQPQLAGLLFVGSSLLCVLAIVLGARGKK